MRGPGVSVPPRWAFAALGLGLFLAGLGGWSPFPAGIWHDDGVYALIGRALAAGEGLRYGGVVGMPPAVKFPPLYPLVLAGFWGFEAEVARAVPLIEVGNLAFLAGAGALFARYLHRSLGIGLGWAVGTGALAFLAVPLWRLAWIPLSEPLFLLLLVAGAGAGARLEARAGDRASLLLFLLAFAFAVHTRTAAVVLPAAVGGALLLRGRRREAVLVAVGSLLVLVPWILWSTAAASRIPRALQDLLGPYGAWLAGQVAEAPGLYVEALHGQALALLRRITVLLVPLPPDVGAWGAVLRWSSLALFVPAFLLGADRVWARAPSAVLLAGVYLVLVWLWPFGEMRLVAPILPFLVLLLVEGFRWSGEGSVLPGRAADAGGGEEGEGAGDEGGVGRRGGFLPRAWRGAGVVWAAGFALLSTVGLFRGWGEEPYRIRSVALGRALEAVEEHAPPGAVVGAPELWPGIQLHSGRTVAPSARFRPRGRPGPVWGRPEEQFSLWSETGIEYLLVEHGGRVHGDALARLEEACGAGAVESLEAWDSVRFVRLAWDEACRARLGVRSDS